jgi:hypothetical protein
MPPKNKVVPPKKSKSKSNVLNLSDKAKFFDLLKGSLSLAAL